MTALLADHVDALQSYSACDISDALLKLQVPSAGALVDLHLYTPQPATAATPSPRKTIAPASTVLFTPKDSSIVPPLPDTSLPEPNIPPGSHYADLTTPGSIVFICDLGQRTNAVLGGIMARRMKILGAKGVVVKGRIRDVAELGEVGLPIWASGTSTAGAGAGSKVHAINIPVRIGDVTVKPGDIMFCDPVEGIVLIPQDLVGKVVEILPDLVAAEEKIVQDVSAGGKVSEAMRKHRKP
ncbi:MAG: hypothetical protein M1817_003055 [Caeruleum heppii]|nr:MAG: hypothetical protein M1817_003055 [Caeruleum heppii]